MVYHHAAYRADLVVSLHEAGAPVVDADTEAPRVEAPMSGRTWAELNQGRPAILIICDTDTIEPSTGAQLRDIARAHDPDALLIGLGSDAMGDVAAYLARTTGATDPEVA